MPTSAYHTYIIVDTNQSSPTQIVINPPLPLLPPHQNLGYATAECYDSRILLTAEHILTVNIN